jgi:Co/Zn/Cd efflux system component
MFKNINEHRAILIVAILNFGYFFVEFFVALNITSVSLFADSIDFLEDAFTSFLILWGLYLSLQNRMRLAYLLIGLIFVPSLFTLVFAINQFLNPVVTNGFSLTSYAMGALIINIFCAFLMARFKTSDNSLLLTAFYSARNDALANIAMIIAGVMTLYTVSHYPDLIVGVLIFLLNLDASKAVYEQIKMEKE